jgi:hypothetical protein
VQWGFGNGFADGPGTEPVGPGHRFQVTGFRFQVSGHRSQVTGFRFQVSGFRSQVTGFRFQVGGSPGASGFP